MDDYKWTDIHFPLSAVNAGMFAISAAEGDPGMMAFNGGLFALNAGLATSGRKDELKADAAEVKDASLGSVYDRALKEGIMEASNEIEVERGRRTSERRVC